MSRAKDLKKAKPEKVVSEKAVPGEGASGEAVLGSAVFGEMGPGKVGSEKVAFEKATLEKATPRGAALGKMVARKVPRKAKQDLATLINAESALGRTLFGEIPEGHQREFFAARKNIWIWHENWTDQHGRPQELTIRYEVHPNGVYKRANRGKYEKLEGEELDNFRLAAKSYLKIIKQRLYY